MNGHRDPDGAALGIACLTCWRIHRSTEEVRDSTGRHVLAPPAPTPDQRRSLRVRLALRLGALSWWDRRLLLFVVLPLAALDVALFLVRH